MIDLRHLILLGISVGLAGGCTAASRHAASDAESVTTIEVSGRTSSPVSGYYVRDGRRFGVTNAFLPITISTNYLSEFEIRKGDDQQMLTITAYQSGAKVSGTTGPGTVGFYVSCTNGLELHGISK